jgi:hypothetical protein
MNQAFSRGKKNSLSRIIPTKMVPKYCFCISKNQKEYPASFLATLVAWKVCSEG